MAESGLNTAQLRPQRRKRKFVDCRQNRRRLESGRNREKVIVGICLVFTLLMTRCQMSDRAEPAIWPYSMPQEADTIFIASGDLILRMGNSFYSPIARNISSRERRFSHVGIAVVECGAVFVIHAEANDSAVGGVRINSVVDFLAGTKDWGIYRLQAPEAARIAVAQVAENYLALATPFDLDFDAADTTKFYCSELAMHCINHGVGRPLVQPRTWVGDKPYVAIDDTYLNDQTFRVR
ncbi:MAG: hypothetical protein HC821_01590 [Lewinella sp.]|nr:hypothetical protein [Lewinella sp.]